jgi:hypothetical protein
MRKLGLMKLASRLDLLFKQIEAADLNQARALKERMMDSLKGKFLNLYGSDQSEFEDDAESAIWFFAQDSEPKLGDPLQGVKTLSRHRHFDMQAPEGLIGDMVDYLKKQDLGMTVALEPIKSIYDTTAPGFTQGRPLVPALDKVADALEAAGLLKEAMELDIISNTLERIFA